MITRKCPHCGEEIRIEAIKCKYCREFIVNLEEDYFSSTSYPQNKIKVPNSWFALQKWTWICWVGLFLIYFLLRFKTDEDSIKLILNVFVFLIDVYALFFIRVLLQYLKNFMKEFPIFKIYFWMLIINSLVDFIFVFDDIYFDLSDVWLIIASLFIVILLVSKLITAISLMSIKNDIIGGIKTIGTFMVLVSIIDIFLLLFTFIVGILMVMSEDGISTINNNNIFDSYEIVGNYVTIASNIILISLISRSLKKAIIHNKL